MDTTLIADLVRAGVDPDLVGRVVNALLAANSPRTSADKSADSPVDEAAEKRRAYDRERQRIRRQSGGHPQTSAESADGALTTKKDIKERKSSTRLSADWKPTQPDLEYATSKGMVQTRIDTEAEKFRNYWTAKSGRDAAKADWPATWRNWVLTSLERLPGNNPGRPLTNDEKFFGVGRIPGII